MAKTIDEVRATRETVQEATDLYNRGGIQITRYSAGKGKLGVQVSTGYKKYIQLTEPQMKTLAQILPKLQRDLRKDLLKKEDVNESLVGYRGSDVGAGKHSASATSSGRHNSALATLNGMAKKHEKEHEKSDHLGHSDALKAIDHAGSKLNKHGADHADFKTALSKAKDASKKAFKMNNEEALKGNQHKLDHDKDGDIDAKDFAALRNKKKKKKGKEDTAEMNPKLDDGKDNKEQKESTMSIRDKLIAVLEGDRAAHYKGATKPQDYEEILGTGPGAKKMIDDHKPAPVDPKFDGNVAAKATAEAGKKTNQSKKRENDKDQGDKKIVNPVAGAKTESVRNIVKAYESMYEKKNESVVKSADKKPEVFTKPDGKKGVRMVPVDKQVVKTEKKDVEEKLTPQQKVARDAGRGKGKAATDYVKARMKSAAGTTDHHYHRKQSDLDNRIHKGAPGDHSPYSDEPAPKHDTSARPKDKLASQPDIKTRLKNKKARGDLERARKQSQSPSGRNNMGGVGIRY